MRWDYYSSFFPDQDILPSRYRDFFYAGAALPNGYSIPATPYAASLKIPGVSDIETYSSFAPRVGVAWDILGNGRTTLKLNYGRFYHNTGIESGGVNPAQEIRYTFSWIDRNGDRVFQDNEFGNFVSSGGGTTNQVDPNKKHTYTDSYSVWFERELLDNLGFRAGYTFRNDDNNAAAVQVARIGSFLCNWDRDRGFVQNPNQERFNDRTVTTWSWKAYGTWNGPAGIRVTPMVRHQSGDPLAREALVSLRTGTLTYQAGSFVHRDPRPASFPVRHQDRRVDAAKLPPVGGREPRLTALVL